MIDLYKEQWDAVNTLAKGKILVGDTGSGKTITSLVYTYIKVCKGVPHGLNGMQYKRMENPKDIYVITTARKRDDNDWYTEAAKLGIGRKANEMGIQLHVDSWNNISQYEDVEDAVFLFDEARGGGKGKWSKTFVKIAKKNHWILLSATPGDVWSDYASVFIANGFYKNITEFEDRHIKWVRKSSYPKVDRWLEEGHLLKLRQGLLVDIPIKRHTRRHSRNVPVGYDKHLYDRITKDRWNPYTDEPIKDAGEMFRLMRKAVNSDISRLGAVMQEMERHPKMIVFYNFDYELAMLRTLWSSTGIPQKEWNGHKHEPVPEGNEWLYLVQYSAGAEAWNCITTDTILFYSLSYSYRATQQSKGRIDRLNTPYFDLNYLSLVSSASIDRGIQKAQMLKQDFNEKGFIP